jgi:hypothetical protein
METTLTIEQVNEAKKAVFAAQDAVRKLGHDVASRDPLAAILDVARHQGDALISTLDALKAGIRGEA